MIVSAFEIKLNERIGSRALFKETLIFFVFFLLRCAFTLSRRSQVTKSSLIKSRVCIKTRRLALFLPLFLFVSTTLWRDQTLNLAPNREFSLNICRKCSLSHQSVYARSSFNDKETFSLFLLSITQMKIDLWSKFSWQQIAIARLVFHILFV